MDFKKACKLEVELDALAPNADATLEKSFWRVFAALVVDAGNAPEDAGLAVPACRLFMRFSMPETTLVEE